MAAVAAFYRMSWADVRALSVREFRALAERMDDARLDSQRLHRRS